MEDENQGVFPPSRPIEIHEITVGQIQPFSRQRDPTPGPREPCPYRLRMRAR